MLKASDLAQQEALVLDCATARALAAATACRIPNHRLAFDINLDTLELLNAHSAEVEALGPAEVETYLKLRVVTLYNLTVESIHLHLKRDAENYIALAAELVVGIPGSVVLKNKVNWLCDEYQTAERPQSPGPNEPAAERTPNLLPGESDSEKLVIVEPEP